MKVALDCDGVISNFFFDMCQKYEKPYAKIDTWNIDWISEKFHEIENDHDFWANMSMLNHPSSLNFEFDYYISAFPIGMRKARQKWLDDNGYPKKPLIHAYDKLPIMRKFNVDVLIDDKPENCKQVQDAGLIAIRYQPYYFDYQDDCKYVAHSMIEVKNILEQIKKES
mgnify:CR=1 FL=1